MEPPVDQYLSRIVKIQPDLQIQTVTLNGEGFFNDIVIVNGDTVFRFVKNEAGIAALQAELTVLECIRPYLDLQIPTPFHTGRDVMAYHFLPGVAFDRHLLSKLGESARQACADQLALFLKQLHAIPLDERLPLTSVPVRYDDWVEIRQRVEEKVYPALMRHQREWATRLFDRMLSNPQNFQYTPSLIHGDLSCYHILFSPMKKQIDAVIDFGVAGIGDPANDIACLIQYYGETFIRLLTCVYPEIAALIPRARFYAQALELQWVLSAVLSGDPFWFTAHLGNARDLDER